MDWKTFQVASTVVHYVPTKKDEEDPQLLLTTATIALDGELTNYFADKVAGRLRNNGLVVVPDGDRDATATSALAAVLDDADDIVDQSRTLASHLFDVQTAQNSSGLLAVLGGSVDGRECVAIVKLERQRGVSFEIDASEGTVDLELLRNLTLTDKTKIYKTAVFTKGDDGASVVGHVADNQKTSGRGSQVAGFFLADFLGCKPQRPAASVTYKFVEAANRAFNDSVESVESRGEYQIALMATLQDNSTTINPTDFAESHLAEDHRAAFLKQVTDAGIDVDESFAKDTSRVNVSRFKMTFESGMVLIGPPDALESNVALPALPGPEDPVQLYDTVSSLLSGR